jgi:hypothetical protein
MVNFEVSATLRRGVHKRDQLHQSLWRDDCKKTDRGLLRPARLSPDRPDRPRKPLGDAEQHGRRRHGNSLALVARHGFELVDVYDDPGVSTCYFARKTR